MALLVGGPLVSGVLRRPPVPLPVIDQVPATGRGRLVLFLDPACSRCVESAQGAIRALSPHLRSVRPGFDLDWIPLGPGSVPELGPLVRRVDDTGAAPLRALFARSAAREELLEGKRGVLIDAGGRVRALPVLSAPPGPELLPAITQVVNGR
jgi:hypothetical protein